MIHKHPSTLMLIEKYNIGVHNVNDSVAHMHGTIGLYAAQCGDTVALKLLISLGLDLNVPTNYRALELAIMSKNLDTVKFLLNHGADPTRCDRFGRNALVVAIEFEMPEISRLLIDYGAMIDGQTYKCPNWVTAGITKRKNTRITSITVMAIQKYRKPKAFTQNNRDAIRQIAKHIWSLRF
jgi:hypothetical protein